MKQGSYVIGIDVGTSSVKALAVFQDGSTLAVGASYQKEPPPACWETALYSAVSQLTAQISGLPRALSLCAQVGSYLIETPTGLRLTSWQQGGGKEALARVLNSADQNFFNRHLSMPHPPLKSYPLVRLIETKGEEIRSFLAPKDYLYQKLTGVCCSDPYTWRGLADLKSNAFSPVLLSRFGINKDILPHLQMPWQAPGTLCDQAAKRCGINGLPPVFLGCNDFFAGVLGMGANSETAFDLTGTSEHLGLLSEKRPDCSLITGPYFFGEIAYGGTASSGPSMSWAFQNFGKGKNFFRRGQIYPNAPIFLPYLGGERAPIWDSDARGVFFGLTAAQGDEALFYAVMEGVAFSVFSLWENLGRATNAIQRVAVGGGASGDRTLNRLKASLLERPLSVCGEKSCGALGAALIALFGLGDLGSLQEGQALFCKAEELVYPDPAMGKQLKARYEIYRELYPALKEQFARLAQLNGEDPQTKE